MSGEKIPNGFSLCKELSVPNGSDEPIFGNLNLSKITRIVSKPKGPSREGEEFLADVANSKDGSTILRKSYVGPRTSYQGSRDMWYPFPRVNDNLD